MSGDDAANGTDPEQWADQVVKDLGSSTIILGVAGQVLGAGADSLTFSGWILGQFNEEHGRVGCGGEDNQGAGGSKQGRYRVFPCHCVTNQIQIRRLIRKSVDPFQGITHPPLVYGLVASRMPRYIPRSYLHSSQPPMRYFPNTDSLVMASYLYGVKRSNLNQGITLCHISVIGHVL